jgi:hypothetical protein
MESVWLLLGGGRDVQSARPDLGSSWFVAVSLRKPPILGVGKAWISLDSLVKIDTYQRVTRISLESFFLTALVVAKEPARWLARDLGRERDGLLIRQA